MIVVGQVGACSVGHIWLIFCPNLPPINKAVLYHKALSFRVELLSTLRSCVLERNFCFGKYWSRECILVLKEKKVLIVWLIFYEC